MCGRPAQLLRFHHDGKGLFDPRPFDQQRHSLRQVGGDDVFGHVPESADGLPGDFQDFVVGLEARLPGSAACCHAADNRRALLHAAEIGNDGEDHGENQVHDYARRNDGHPLGNVLRKIAAGIEEGMAVFASRPFGGGSFARIVRRLFACGGAGRLGLGAGRLGLGAGRLQAGPFHFFAKLGGIVFLAEHLHVAAQGQDADAV